jgi:hypothetical protein
MDLNHLYHRRGVSLIRAEYARCEQSRSAHRDLAGTYAARIAQLVRGSGPLAA